MVENKFRNNALSNPNDANQIAWFDGFVWHLALRLRACPTVLRHAKFQTSELYLAVLCSHLSYLCPCSPKMPQDTVMESTASVLSRHGTRSQIPEIFDGVSVEFRISRSRSDRRTQIYAEANLSGARYNRDGSPRSMLYLGDHCLTLGRNTKVEELLGQVLLDLVDWIYAQNGRVDPTMERNDLLRIGKLISLSKAKDVAAAVKLGDFGSLVSCSLPPYGYPIGSLLDAHARLGALEARMLGISCC